MKNKNCHGPDRKKKEVKYVIDVPKSFIEYCYNHTRSKEEKQELKALLKNFDKFDNAYSK